MNFRSCQKIEEITKSLKKLKTIKTKTLIPFLITKAQLDVINTILLDNISNFVNSYIEKTLKTLTDTHVESRAHIKTEYEFFLNKIRANDAERIYCLYEMLKALRSKKLDNIALNRNEFMKIIYILDCNKNVQLKCGDILHQIKITDSELYNFKGIHRFLTYKK
ncbi:hypothetical protein EDEG_00770 [Edhazardia aedis USNM 41457]|uniref:Uncharacterized protein n=1 Tax=Edhazardia aedis (strain USNM 41457) TaxID=1003232 RepID=J9DBN6_EDHAE|nr:hypothetical protein EDEG_00770 [Edhazardia aedis USNM 41457]|eukprot:EJW05136.1 hypothetical protein EDEG_00770 [Edhazardia aedis USNM 41457]